jgi:hypothetical protein
VLTIANMAKAQNSDVIYKNNKIDICATKKHKQIFISELHNTRFEIVADMLLKT